jgi:hypothetical protein
LRNNKLKYSFPVANTLFKPRVVFRFNTSYMQQSPSWVADIFTASQEIPRVLWELEVSLQYSQEPPFTPIMSQINPVHNPILFLENPF